MGCWPCVVWCWRCLLFVLVRWLLLAAGWCEREGVLQFSLPLLLACHCLLCLVSVSLACVRLAVRQLQLLVSSAVLVVFLVCLFLVFPLLAFAVAFVLLLSCSG